MLGDRQPNVLLIPLKQPTRSRPFPCQIWKIVKTPTDKPTNIDNTESAHRRNAAKVAETATNGVKKIELKTSDHAKKKGRCRQYS